jgi:hypothetical protein
LLNLNVAASTSRPTWVAPSEKDEVERVVERQRLAHFPRRQLGEEEVAGC